MTTNRSTLKNGLTALIATAMLGVAASPAAAADTKILLVHGHGPYKQGKDCNGATWKDALRYYQDAGGRARGSMNIAKSLANYIHGEYTSKGRPVDVIAHSMGGLITRVALLGSAQGWDGFPSGKLDVDDVVTLSTPHRGVNKPSARKDRQWRQMRPGSAFLERLHEDGSGLGDDWAGGTDWTLVGSKEDATVSYASGTRRTVGHR